MVMVSAGFACFACRAAGVAGLSARSHTIGRHVGRGYDVVEDIEGKHCQFWWCVIEAARALDKHLLESMFSRLH